MKFNFQKFPFILFLSLVGCSENFDFDMRDQFGGLLDTSSAANGAVARRPDPDDSGVITFSNYQVIVARSGDKIGDLAKRLGVNSATLGSYNGISQEAILRHGEIIALPPNIVANGATGKPLVPTVIDISELSDDINPTNRSTNVEPKRHRVTNGETAFTIARLHNVSANDLADWNSLDTQKNVRNGQYLLIPLTQNIKTKKSIPGQGSLTPVPPSSIRPQLQADVKPNIAEAAAITQSAASDTGKTTRASIIETRFERPTSGSIIRSYKKGQNEGIDISAKPGSTVFAADDGTVAAITKDRDGIPILVIKHVDGFLTVYTNIDALTVKKNDLVKRGQKVAKVRDSSPSFLHFEVRRGLVSVDPDDYI